MNNNITTIITLYKTPEDKLKNLKQYRSFPLFIFEQEGSINSKKKIQNKLKRRFKYFSSDRNIGLSRATNILFKKVKSRYLLFTQADINIDQKSILSLMKIFKKNRYIIFVTPTFSKKNLNSSKKKFKYVKKIKAACILCDVKKLRKIGFFDDDYFLYWEDIDLMQKINNTKFKMVVVNNIFARHESSQSSVNSIKTQYLRNSNFMYGELIFDLKHEKLRLIKIIRKLLQNLFLFFFNIIRFDIKNSVKNFSIICGILKFTLYSFKR